MLWGSASLPTLPGLGAGSGSRWKSSPGGYLTLQPGFTHGQGRRGHQFREGLCLAALQQAGSRAGPGCQWGPISDQAMEALKPQSSEQSPSEVPSFCSGRSILVAGSGQGA